MKNRLCQGKIISARERIKESAYGLCTSYTRMNIKFLNLLELQIEWGKEKNRGDETFQIIIHIFMEMLHGNTLYSYIKQNKMPFFSIKTVDRKAKQVLSGEWILVGWERI
jgi:hypothetical protein